MIQSLRRPMGAVFLALGFVSMSAIASAGDLESEIELLRSDLKTGKIEVVKEALNLDSATADKFWPVYREYQNELSKIGDERLALVKDYAANFEQMTDEKAKLLVKQALDLQSKRTDLLKKHYKNFEKVLGSIEAAKLVQVESLINSLIDVQLGSEMPLIQKTATR